MVVASGISSTISAGISIGGLANVAGNVTVGQNVTVTGTMTVGGKAVLTTANLISQAPVPVPYGWYSNADAGQIDFVLSVNSTIPLPTFVSRNGLIEVPGPHYGITGNVLSFSTPCIGGETIYAYWNGQ